jgi:hypothetical protein
MPHTSSSSTMIMIITTKQSKCTVKMEKFSQKLTLCGCADNGVGII